MNKTKSLQQVFEDYFKVKVEKIAALPASGSYREYYRLRVNDISAIGVYNIDKKENEAFLSFTRHFLSKDLPVPRIYSENLDQCVYLQEDLGDTTLFSKLNEIRTGDDFPLPAIDIYKKVLEQLPLFQVFGNEGLDYSICYPRQKFDKQSMMWDLNYFKYYFLKLAKVPFDEQLLENDFMKFSDWLLEADNDYFLYRDFQSRNIMLQKGQPFYIDYQGGRKGALQYDVASLLFDAKADIPPSIKEELLEHYLEYLSKHINVDINNFKKYYFGFVLIRLMQAMGAFGFRGFYEKKPHFLASIPYAISNLTFLLNQYPIDINIPHLESVLNSLHEAPELKQFNDKKNHTDKLAIELNSFSYRRGIPVDLSENGGGFVFDCRAIHNPGRYDDFKQLTGKDSAVITFLEKQSQANQFVEDALALVKPSISNYIDRQFTNLMVNFGCTGGQHRSVYCVEKMNTLLRKEFGDSIEIHLHHREEELKSMGI